MDSVRRTSISQSCVCGARTGAGLNFKLGKGVKDLRSRRARLVCRTRRAPCLCRAETKNAGHRGEQLVHRSFSGLVDWGMRPFITSQTSARASDSASARGAPNKHALAIYSLPRNGKTRIIRTWPHLSCAATHGSPARACRAHGHTNSCPRRNRRCSTRELCSQYIVFCVHTSNTSSFHPARLDNTLRTRGTRLNSP